jgi:Arc/MetJ-type ribon-helix-helix transcriptional regulator
MKISLDSALEKLIAKRVKSGKYASPEAVLAAALFTLDQQEQFGDFAPGELDALIAEGERSIHEEGTIDGEQAYKERRGQRAQRRKKVR